MFIVVGLQTNFDGQVANLVTSFANKQEAESKYHQILASAATSSLYIHAAVMLNERGEAEKNEFYRHEQVEEQ